MTLGKSDVEEPYNINEYRSFVGQIMWYTIKVGPEMANTEREFEVHMSNPRTEHPKALGDFIVYLKVKETKIIAIRKPKVLKAVMFCDSKNSTYKETRKSVSGLIATI